MTTERIQRLLANRFAKYEPPYAEPFHDAWLAFANEPDQVRLARAICAQWLSSRLVVEPDELIVGRLELSSIVSWSFNSGVSFDRALYQQRYQQAVAGQCAYLEEIERTWHGRSSVELINKVVLPSERALVQHHGLATPGCHSSPLLIRLAEEGTSGLRQRVAQARQTFLGKPGCERAEWYSALEVVLDGMDKFSLAYGQAVRHKAALIMNPIRQAELEEIAVRCERVIRQPSATFADALQAYWLATVMHRPDSPGRFDQDLGPWLECDLATGTITVEQAQELVDCIWLKFAENRCWSLTLGGQKAEGGDATNELTYLCLDSLRRLRTDAPNVELRVHRGTPQRLLVESCALLAEGLSMPALVNDEPVIKAMLHRGIGLEHARDYSLVGCTQVVSRGRCSGAACELTTYTDLERAWTTQLDYAIRTATDIVNRQYAVIGEYYPDFYKSLLIEGCLEQGKDYRHGGALYTEGLVDVLGITNVGDSLLALRQVVYEQQRCSLPRMVEILDDDWVDEEALRQECLNRVPKFGNADPQADELTVAIFTQVNNAFLEREKLYGRRWGMDVIGWTGSVIWGQRTGATPDGRRRGAALCDSVGASQGRDRHGATALLRSVSRLPHDLYHGILALNLRFAASTFGGSDGTDKMVHLVNGALVLGLQQLQINVVNADRLRAAQDEPAAYEALMVRIGGFSTYFNWLSKEHQDDIIARTEHELG